MSLLRSSLGLEMAERSMQDPDKVAELRSLEVCTKFIVVEKRGWATAAILAQKRGRSSIGLSILVRVLGVIVQRVRASSYCSLRWCGGCPKVRRTQALFAPFLTLTSVSCTPT